MYYQRAGKVGYAFCNTHVLITESCTYLTLGHMLLNLSYSHSMMIVRFY